MAYIVFGVLDGVIESRTVHFYNNGMVAGCSFRRICWRDYLTISKEKFNLRKSVCLIRCISLIDIIDESYYFFFDSIFQVQF